MRYAKNADETCDATITIRIKSETKERLMKGAEKMNRTLSDYLKMSLEKWLEWESTIMECDEDMKRLGEK